MFADPAIADGSQIRGLGCDARRADPLRERDHDRGAHHNPEHVHDSRVADRTDGARSKQHRGIPSTRAGPACGARVASDTHEYHVEFVIQRLGEQTAFDAREQRF